MPPEALRLAVAGKIHRLTKLTLSRVPDSGKIQTEIQAFVKDRAVPVTFTDTHADDDAAM